MSAESEALGRAVKAAGSKTKLAALVGVTLQAVSQWDKVPLARLMDVARVTGIPAQELRPDVFKSSEAA